MKIGLDFDGVVSNLGKLKAFVLKKVYGVSVPHTKADAFYIIENKILSRDGYIAFKKLIYEDIDAHLFMEPVRGAVTNIKKLQADGHEVKIVTARTGVALDVANKWLKKHHLHLPIEGIGFENTKHDAVKGFDIYVDDLLIQLSQMMDVVPHRYLFSWGYNEKYDEMGIAHRVKSWHKLYDEIWNLEHARKKRKQKHALHT
ncbi:hypothetical protein CL654_02965 [bacterium]|nr:hypothetical protein [bacterium]|tara:strand:+ start:608 stop:1210 length:603 start_codon:yes stop_codon:yes gene_type:complete